MILMKKGFLQKHLYVLTALGLMSLNSPATEERQPGQTQCLSVIAQGSSCHPAFIDTSSLRVLREGLDSAVIKQDTQSIQNALINVLEKHPETLDGVLKFLQRNPQYKDNQDLQQALLKQVESNLLSATSFFSFSKEKKQLLPHQAFEAITLLKELGYLNDPEGTKLVSKWLRESKNAHFTQAIVQAAPEQSVRFIQQSMLLPKSKKTTSQQLTAIQATSYLHSQQGLPLMRKWLQHPSNSVRVTAVTYSASNMDLNTVPELMTLALQDSNKDVRSTAAGFTGRWPDTLHLTAQALQDKNTHVRESARMGLLDSNYKEFLPIIGMVQLTEMDKLDPQIKEEMKNFEHALQTHICRREKEDPPSYCQPPTSI